MNANTNPTVEAVASRPAFPVTPTIPALNEDCPELPLGAGSTSGGIDTLTYIATRLMAAQYSGFSGQRTAQEAAELAVIGARALIAEILANPEALRELLEDCRDILEHIESCDESALLACDSDPHSPSVFSVLGERLARSLNKITA